MALRTVSPSMTNRTSPPVTRAASRSGIRQPFDTSTPVTRRSLQPGMHIETVERMFESADDTDIDLNSSKFVYKEHFTVKEMTSMKKEMWYDWLEYRIRMVRRRFVPSFKTVREVFIMMLLAVIFCSCTFLIKSAIDQLFFLISVAATKPSLSIRKTCGVQMWQLLRDRSSTNRFRI